jgi:hypothetical protein
MAEQKVRCPYCPQEVVVSQLHRHCSAYHWDRDPDAPGREIERRPRRERDVAGQLLLYTVLPED